MLYVNEGEVHLGQFKNNYYLYVEVSFQNRVLSVWSDCVEVDRGRDHAAQLICWCSKHFPIRVYGLSHDYQVFVWHVVKFGLENYSSIYKGIV